MTEKKKRTRVKKAKPISIAETISVSKRVEDKTLQLPLTVFTKNELSSAGLVSPRFKFERLAKLLEVSTFHARAVSQIAQDVAGSGFQLIAKDEEKAGEEEKMRLMQFLESGLLIPSVDFVKRTDQDLRAFGNAFWELRWLNGDLFVSHLPALYIRMHKDGQKYAEKVGQSLRWFQSNLSSTVIDRDTGAPTAVKSKQASKIVHLKLYSQSDPVYGSAPIIPAISAALLTKLINDFNINFFENAATVRLFILLKGAEPDQKMVEQIKAFIASSGRGVENAHRALILNTPDGEIEIKEASSGFEGDFMQLYKLSRDEIFAADQIPSYRASLSELGSLGGSTAKESDKIYVDGTVKPDKSLIEHTFNSIIVRQELGIKDWKVELKSFSIEEEKDKADLAVQLTNAKLLSVDEGRALIGKDPIGVDRPFLPSPTGPIFLSKSQKEHEEQIIKASRRRAAQTVKIIETETKAFWEDLLEKILDRYLDVFQKKQLSLSKRFLDVVGLSKADPTFSESDVPPVDAELFTGVYADVYRKIVSEAVQDMQEITQVPLEFNFGNPEAQQFVAKRGLELAKTITSSLRPHLNTIIKEGVKEGQSLQTIAKEMAFKFRDKIKPWKALQIARTETTIAYHNAKRDMIKANHVDGKWMWKIAADDACPICWGLQDGSPYETGSEPSPAADSHPNCRCDQIFIPQ